MPGHDHQRRVADRRGELGEERAGHVERLRQRAVAQLDRIAQQDDAVRALELRPQDLAEARDGGSRSIAAARSEVEIGENRPSAFPESSRRRCEAASSHRWTKLADVRGCGERACRPKAGIPVENPATGETIATVADLGADQVRAMVAQAREAQPVWEAIGFAGRAEVLLAARRWMVANAERVVATIVGETGRPADETQFAELGYGLSALEFWAKTAPDYLADEEIESASPFLRGRRLWSAMRRSGWSG